MFTIIENSTRRTVSAMAAVAIVSLSGLVMDQGHLAGAPRGIVEVGELTLVNEAQMAAVMLPEVTVVAKRGSAARSPAGRAAGDRRGCQAGCHAGCTVGRGHGAEVERQRCRRGWSAKVVW